MQLAAIDRPSSRGNKPMPISDSKAVKCVEVDRQFISTGVMFEPLQDSRMFFYYTVIRFGRADNTELVLMTDTHRVIIRGARLWSLADHFRDQRVRTVRALPEADQMLADSGTGDTPIVEEIRIEPLGEDGPELSLESPTAHRKKRAK
jgi:hypothetical protein